MIAAVVLTLDTRKSGGFWIRLAFGSGLMIVYRINPISAETMAADSLQAQIAVFGGNWCKEAGNGGEYKGTAIFIETLCGSGQAVSAVSASMCAARSKGGSLARTRRWQARMIGKEKMGSQLEQGVWESGGWAS